MAKDPIILTDGYDRRRNKLIRTLYKLVKEQNSIDTGQEIESALKERTSNLIDTGIVSLWQLIDEKQTYIKKERIRLTAEEK
jgi:hypothetical protein